MKYKLQITSKFKQNLKLLKKQGFDKALLNDVVAKLQNDEKLDAKYLDHPLQGQLRHYRECHITPDCLLVYKKKKDQLILVLVSIGSHANLFK